MTPERLKSVELYAWVGEDELGSGEIGLKQGLVPAGFIALVSAGPKVAREDIQSQMALQAERFGKKIYLCRFTFAGVMRETIAGEPL
jgi:hypothetical protein